jgi:hypothetical protein
VGIGAWGEVIELVCMGTDPVYISSKRTRCSVRMTYNGNDRVSTHVANDIKGD